MTTDGLNSVVQTNVSSVHKTSQLLVIILQCRIMPISLSDKTLTSSLAHHIAYLQSWCTECSFPRTIIYLQFASSQVKTLICFFLHRKPHQMLIVSIQYLTVMVQMKIVNAANKILTDYNFSAVFSIT